MTSTPPPIDSAMYFLSRSEVWVNLMPALAVMSTSSGIGRFLQTTFLAPGGGGGATACACEKALLAISTVSKRTTPVRSRRKIAIGWKSRFLLSQVKLGGL